MSAVLHELHVAFAPYSRPQKARHTSCAAFPEAEPPALCSESQLRGSHHSVPLGSRVALDSINCKPVVADRIKWKYSPSFDPRPFLKDSCARITFEDPNALRKPRWLWPSIARARVHGSKHEVLKLAQLWDQVGALRVFRLEEIDDPRECVGLFCVGKDSQFDRLILNPVVANSRVWGLNHYTKSLGHGAQLCALHIPPGCVARFCADDLAEFYYTVAVSEARAKRNAVGMVFEARELSHLVAFDKTRHWGSCVVALACLATGDRHAVELAQQSHFEVLRTVAGCLVPSEVVLSGNRFLEAASWSFYASMIMSRCKFSAGLLLCEGTPLVTPECSSNRMSHTTPLAYTLTPKSASATSDRPPCWELTSTVLRALSPLPRIGRCC